MSNQDQIITDILNKQYKFSDKRQTITNYRKSLLINNVQETNDWNAFVNNYIQNPHTTHTKINAENELRAMTELLIEFNLIYSEKGGIVTTYSEGQLDTVYKCVEMILARFHIIQSEGIEIAKKSHKELKYLLLIMKNLMEEFRKLIKKSYCLFEENIKHQKFERLRNENLMREKEKQRIINEQINRDSENKCLQARYQINEENLVRQIEANRRNENNDLSAQEEQLDTKGKDDLKPEERDYQIPNEERVEEVFKDMWSIGKEYCHNIRKTVNNMCSQITSKNPQHTIERLQQILSFLRGNNISLVGSDSKKHINLKQHRDAPKLFWYLFYRAVLIQAESQFAENTETAVAFASFAVALFGAFPDKMDDLLRLIYDHYPVFVGRSIPIVDIDYYLLSLKGVARLLAALAVAVPPPNYHRSSGGLCHGQLWSLLAAMEAAPVQESVSAEAINGLLEIAGNSLWRLYGVQFEKMLQAIKTKYESVAEISAIALVLMIDEALIKKKFDLDGCLSVQSWQSCNQSI